jgi:hypothetical protein
MVSVPKLRLVLPLLLNVTNSTALVLPTSWLPKEREEGEKLTLAKPAMVKARTKIGSTRRRLIGSPASKDTDSPPMLTSAKTPTSTDNFDARILSIQR